MSVPLPSAAAPILRFVVRRAARVQAACPVAAILGTFVLTRKSLEERLDELEGGLILRTPGTDGARDVALTVLGAWEMDPRP